MTATKFILVKKCLQCSAISPMEMTRCVQCNYLFLGEATKQEEQEFNKKIAELQKKREMEV